MHRIYTGFQFSGEDNAMGEKKLTYVELSLSQQISWKNFSFLDWRFQRLQGKFPTLNGWEHKLHQVTEFFNNQ